MMDAASPEDQCDGPDAFAVRSALAALEGLLRRRGEPHIAPTKSGRRLWRTRVRMRVRGEPYRLSQRCRKKIEELFGEAKDWRGLRRLRRRGPLKVQQEVLMIGWTLNMKRLAKLLNPLPQAT